MQRLTIFFDVVCPFCLIGWRRLEPEIRQSIGLKVEWKPFILDPSVPPEGIPFKSYFERRFGPRAASMHAEVERIGRLQGIAFDFAKTRTYPSTLLAHRMVSLASRHGRGTEAAAAVMEAYHLGGEEVQELDVVVRLAVDHCGLDEPLVRAALSEQDDGVVAAQARAARTQGISFVPSYALDDEFVGDTDAALGVLRGGPRPVLQG